MKPGIHPKYQDATVICSCGNTWQTRSTKPLLRIELCNQCHPFFTGEQRIVDTAGQVERFMRRLENAQPGTPRKKKAERREARLEQRRRLQGRDELLLAPEAGAEQAASE